MMFSPNETVTVKRHIVGAEDDYGNATDAWADPVELKIIAFDPGSSSDPRSPGMERVVVDPTLYVPFGSEIKDRDKIIVRGVEFIANGNENDWKHPGLGVMGGVVSLRRVDG